MQLECSLHALQQHHVFVQLLTGVLLSHSYSAVLNWGMLKFKQQVKPTCTLLNYLPTYLLPAYCVSTYTPIYMQSTRYGMYLKWLAICVSCLVLWSAINNNYLGEMHGKWPVATCCFVL